MFTTQRRYALLPWNPLPSILDIVVLYTRYFVSVRAGSSDTRDLTSSHFRSFVLRVGNRSLALLCIMTTWRNWPLCFYFFWFVSWDTSFCFSIVFRQHFPPFIHEKKKNSLKRPDVRFFTMPWRTTMPSFVFQLSTTQTANVIPFNKKFIPRCLSKSSERSVCIVLVLWQASNCIALHASRNTTSVPDVFPLSIGYSCSFPVRLVGLLNQSNDGCP